MIPFIKNRVILWSKKLTLGVHLKIGILNLTHSITNKTLRLLIKKKKLPIKNVYVNW